jgi:hypothetical protein
MLSFQDDIVFSQDKTHKKYENTHAGLLVDRNYYSSASI